MCNRKKRVPEDKAPRRGNSDYLPAIYDYSRLRRADLMHACVYPFATPRRDTERESNAHFLDSSNSCDKRSPELNLIMFLTITTRICQSNRDLRLIDHGRGVNVVQVVLARGWTARDVSFISSSGKSRPGSLCGLRDSDHFRKSVRGGDSRPLERQRHRGMLRQTKRIPAYRLCQIVSRRCVPSHHRHFCGPQGVVRTSCQTLSGASNIYRNSVEHCGNSKLSFHLFIFGVVVSMNIHTYTLL